MGPDRQTADEETGEHQPGDQAPAGADGGVRSVDTSGQERRGESTAFEGARLQQVSGRDQPQPLTQDAGATARATAGASNSSAVVSARSQMRASRGDGPFRDVAMASRTTPATTVAVA